MLQDNPRRRGQECDCGSELVPGVYSHVRDASAFSVVARHRSQVTGRRQHNNCACSATPPDMDLHVGDASEFTDISRHRSDACGFSADGHSSNVGVVSPHYSSMLTASTGEFEQGVRLEPHESSESCLNGSDLQRSLWHDVPEQRIMANRRRKEREPGCGTGHWIASSVPSRGEKSIAPELALQECDGKLVTQVKLAALSRLLKKRNPPGGDPPGPGPGGEVLKPQFPPYIGGPDHVYYPAAQPPPVGGGSISMGGLPTNTSGWEGSTTAPPTSATHTLKGAHASNGLFSIAVFPIVYTTFQVLGFVLQQTERVRRQWWCEAEPVIADALGPYSDWKLNALRAMFGVAGARLMGSHFLWFHYNDMTVVMDPGACEKNKFDCRVDGDQLLLCVDFWNYTDTEKIEAVIAALLTEPALAGMGPARNTTQPKYTEIYNAYIVAAWARRRWLNNGGDVADLGATGAVGYWDTRPMRTYERQLDLVHSYTTSPKSAIDHSQVRDAWDISWSWVEAAMRFLIRLSVLAKGQDGEEEIRTMWSFGDGIGAPLGGLNCTSWDNCANDPYCSPTEVDDVSMETFFGPFTVSRLLWVTECIMALALRYQGTSSAKFTHFKIRPDVINLEYTAWAEPWTDGNIYLAHQFFLDANVQRRRTVIPHEMFHFLVYPHNAGVPSDQRECGDGNDRCYGFGGAMELVAKDPDLACTNIDNLVLWMCYRYLRWGEPRGLPRLMILVLHGVMIRSRMIRILSGESSPKRRRRNGFRCSPMISRPCSLEP